MTPPALDLVIAGATVVSAAGVARDTSIGIADGRIRGLGSASALGAARTRIDARGLHVLPGAVDAHVHFREPGLTHKEDWETGSAAAALGGVTCVVEMPNTDPPTEDGAALATKVAAAAGRSWTDFALFGLISDRSVELLPSLAAAGAVGFKCFLAQSETGPGCPQPPHSAALLEALVTVARLRMPMIVHAENHEVVIRSIERLRAAGRRDMSAHLESRPVTTELEAIHRIAALARLADAHVHIAHVSSSAGARAIATWKRRGVRITGETSAHYCFLDAERANALGPIARINPPVRSRDDAHDLVEHIAYGTLDTIASDHAPHAAAEKLVDDVWSARAGAIGVETNLALFLSEGVNAGRITLDQLSAAASLRPSSIWGLYPAKGHIAPGADADLVLVDLQAPFQIRNARLHSRHPLSLFDGYTGRGRIVATILRGAVIAREGELVGAPGGRFVTRAVGAPAGSSA